MVFYDFVEDFVEEIFENIKNHDGVAVFAAPEYTISFIKEFLCYGNSEIQYIDYNTYDYDEAYLLEFVEENGKVTLNIQPAISESDVYFSPAGETVLIQAELDVEKIIEDILNNDFTRDDVKFDLFTFEDEDDFEHIDCSCCPERFNCLDAVYEDKHEDDKITVKDNGVTVVKDSNGTLQGFTKMNMFTDENGIHSSSSHSFFSDDVNAIMSAAKALGIEL